MGTDTSTSDEFEENLEPEGPKKLEPAYDKPDIPTLPPNILLLFIIAGIVLNWLMPYPLGSSWGYLGLILVAGAIGGVYSSAQLFKKANTNVRPDQPTMCIVEDGLYRYSRNPMYLCFLIGYTGLSMLMDAPIMLLLTPGLWYVLDKKIIQKEEEYLEEKFGHQYLSFKKTVPRWFWMP